MFLFFLLMCSYIYSQNSSEKWNSYLGRYEYFNGSGYMTGYKEYNKLTGSWDYYTVNQKPRNIYNKVVSPVNETLVREVMASKQARYDANYQRVQNTISDIQAKIQNFDIEEERIKIIDKRFRIEYVEGLNNSKSYDLSNNNIARQIVNWLYTGYNKIISEE